MKHHKYFVRLSIIVMCSFLITSCEDKKADKTIPKSGEWYGSYEGGFIRFYISDDGEMITGEGSTLPENASIIVKIPLSQSCYGASATTNYLYNEIEIEDNKFNITSYSVSVYGTFDSKTSASGSAEYEESCSYPYSGTNRGQVEWNGSPKE